MDESLREIYFYCQENLLAILFGAIGLAGTVFALISWRDSRKTKLIYSYLFDQASKNIDKTITEEQLAQKKREVENESMRIQSLQEQIRRDIPIEARRAVLRDRLNSQIEQLKVFLDSTLNVRQQLSAMKDSTNIPPDLLRAIESEISPEYVIREKRSNLKTLLTLITAASAIASSLLPYPFGKWASWPILILGVPVVLLLAKYSLPHNPVVRKTAIRKIIYWFLFASSAVSICFGLFLLLIWFNDRQYSGNISLYFSIAFTVLGLVASVVGFLLRRRAMQTANFG